MNHYKDEWTKERGKDDVLQKQQQLGFLVTQS